MMMEWSDSTASLGNHRPCGHEAFRDQISNHLVGTFVGSAVKRVQAYRRALRQFIGRIDAGKVQLDTKI